MIAATSSSAHLVGDSEHQDSANGTQTSTKRSRRGTAITNTVTLWYFGAVVSGCVQPCVDPLTFIVACCLVLVATRISSSSVIVGPSNLEPVEQDTVPRSAELDRRCPLPSCVRHTASCRTGGLQAQDLLGH